MKIALVGTSNSVLKDGISTALAANPLVTNLANYSIGASSSVHVVKSTAGVDFSPYDFCIFEFAINEEVLLRNGATAPEQVRRNVSYLATRCLQDGCLPVIVIFPKPMKKELNQARDFYLGYAQAMNLPYLDGAEIVEYLAAKHSLTTQQLFLDKAHVNAWVARIFADIMVSSLERLMEKKGDRIPGESRVGVLEQVSLGSKDEVSDDVIYRGNSKYQDAFRIIKDDGSFVIDMPDPEAAVIGVCVNLTRASCILAVEGTTTCLMDLRNGYFDNPKLTISMLPLRYSVLPKDGKITLRFVPVSDLGDSPIPMKGVLGKVTNPEPANILEISRLLTQKAESISINEVPAPHLLTNLFADCDEDTRDAIFKVQYAVPATA